MNQTLMGVASFLADIIGVYSFLVIIRVCLSWRMNQQGNGFLTFLAKITDPYLGFFKKIFYKGGKLDFSPMWALVALNIIKSILKLFYITGKITFGGVIAIFYSTIWSSVFSFINIILIVVLIVRLNLERKIDPRSMQIKDVIDRMINGIVFKVYNTFYKGKAVTDLRLVQTTLAVFIVLEVVGTVISKVLSAVFL
ncbi:MAG: YggT family protein [Sphaerochaetaceae bacterium]|nr:YggT family protein [Sphaerochaetaceae bacterium]MDD3163229.1 YggT family protein [Sphaerochaetaceae bacterium]MDD4006692.1 YggT family protein [Sphaerochaetaceae bacterium]MDD4396359.1 YggT family protein [Sphaerochaetaceae bacterium]